MNKLKVLAGIVALLVLGFFAFAACAGFGVLIGFIIIIFPWWGIVLGTLVGSLGVFLYLIEGNK